MEYQFTHKDKKGHREQSEGRNGSENSCDYPDKAWYSPEEEIGGNHIDDEKGEGDRYPREQQEDHAAKKQRNDRVPFHGLTQGLHIDKLPPCHSEELDGKEDATYGDNDENSRFRNSNCPYIRYLVQNRVIRIENSETEHHGTGKSTDQKHNTIETMLGFLIEMSIDDIGSDMPSLSQKPGCCKENDPQQGIFGCLHNPYRRLGKQEPHANGVTDSGTYEYEDCPGQGCHEV
jgi:hypothetical protein